VRRAAQREARSNAGAATDASIISSRTIATTFFREGAASFRAALLAAGALSVAPWAERPSSSRRLCFAPCRHRHARSKMAEIPWPTPMHSRQAQAGPSGARARAPACHEPRARQPSDVDGDRAALTLTRTGSRPARPRRPGLRREGSFELDEITARPGPGAGSAFLRRREWARGQYFGSTPATALATTRRERRRPSASDPASDASRIAAAPSLMPDELPAVTGAALLA